MPAVDHDPDAAGSQLAQRLGRCRNSALQPDQDRTLALASSARVTGPKVVQGLTAAYHSLHCGATCGRDRSTELAFEVLPYQLELDLDRAHGPADHAGDLGVGEPLELPDDNLAEGIGKQSEQALDFLHNGDSLLGTGLRAIDVVQHPLRKVRIARVVRSVAALTADVAPIRHVSVSGVDNLAHRDPDQQFPELLPAGRCGLSRGLAVAKAGEHALQDVLLILATQDAVIEMAPDQILEPRRESFPDDPGGLIAHPRIRRPQLVHVSCE